MIIGRFTPTRLRALAGISEGDLVEAVYSRGKIVITPKMPIDRSKFPNADSDYTPEQRRTISARLAKADEDIKNGHTYGPFETAREMITSLHLETRKLRAAKPKPASK